MKASPVWAIRSLSELFSFSRWHRLFWGQLLDFTPFQRSFLARHPLRRFVAALRALIENRVFPAIERGLDSIDKHGLKDVAGRTMNQRRKAIADVCEWL
jgi:hypothetical protein